MLTAPLILYLTAFISHQVAAFLPDQFFSYPVEAILPDQVAAQGATYLEQINRFFVPHNPIWSTCHYTTDAWNNSKIRFLRIQYWAETGSHITLEVAEELENGETKDPPTMSKRIILLAGLNDISVLLSSAYDLHSLRAIECSVYLHYAYQISIKNPNPNKNIISAFTVLSVDVIDRSPSSSWKLPYIPVYDLEVPQKRELLTRVLQIETQCGIVVPPENLPIEAMEWLQKLDVLHFRENLNIWFSVTGINRQVPRSGFFPWIAQKLAQPKQPQPRTDFFLWIAQKLAHPSLDLFAESKIGNKALYIHKECAPDRLDYYKAVGRIMGLAILNNELYDMPFVPSIQKLITNQPIEPLDLQYVDPEKYEKLKSLLDHELPKKPPVWALMHNKVQVELIPNGRTIFVTEQSKFRYVDAFCQWYLKDRIWDQIEAIRQGLFEVVPLKYISVFRARELDSIINDSFLYKWKLHTEYIGCRRGNQLIRCTHGDQLIVWFWECMWSWSNEQRVKLLLYVTKTSETPIQGFANSVNLFSQLIWFKIEVQMHGHTISRGESNTLNLPAFISTRDMLDDRLNNFMQQLETDRYSQESHDKVDILYHDMVLDQKGKKPL